MRSTRLPKRCAAAGLIALGLAGAMALAPAPVCAQAELPAHDGWVTDLAGMLRPQQERELEILMQSYKDGSSHEIALLTVPNLGGRALERFALEVARAWGLGEMDVHNGALLLIAQEERKMRIEVGRGLEGDLTDSISGRIIRNVIAPRFRQGQLYEGIRAGIVAMHEAAGGEYASIPERSTRGSRSSGRGGGSIGILPLLFFAFIFFNLMRRGGGRGCLPALLLGGMMMGGGRRSSGWHGGGGGGGFGGFGGGGGFSGGGASGGW
jgi:uncharacterized protein